MDQIDGFAFVYRRYGPPEVIERVPVQFEPPQTDNILIAVHAASVSSADWRLRSLCMPKGLGWLGRPAIGLFGPRKPVLGTECAGVVIATGPDVTRFQVGDPVIAFPGAALGAHASHLTISQNANVALKPDGLSFEEAAGLCFAGTTAYDYLMRKGALEKGDRILINGASGAVGLALVQLASGFGAHVTAVCSSGNADLVRKQGANDVMPYDLSEITAPTGGFDTVVDIAGNLGWRKAKDLLRSGGQMLLIAGHGRDMILGPAIARLSGKRLISGVAAEDKALFDEVIASAKAGCLRPVVDHIYTPEEMKEAHRRVESRRKQGVVIVKMSSDDGVAEFR